MSEIDELALAIENLPDDASVEFITDSVLPFKGIKYDSVATLKALVADWRSMKTNRDYWWRNQPV